MIYELVYTSAPRGLKPGSRGFATVAQTKGISNALSEALEALSGYEFVFPLGSPDYARNPVNLSHLRLFVGGQRYHVLSRVAAADVDYTGRTNKFAHHIALTEDEVAKYPAGPASLMRNEEFFLKEWKGDPAWIDAEKPLSAKPLFQGVCSTWKTLTGDAGWAGVAADALLNSSDKPVYLIQAPGKVDDKTWAVLLDELLSLLPASERWDTTFSTYFTQIPSGVQGCSLRGVVEGSKEHRRIQNSANILHIPLLYQNTLSSLQRQVPVVIDAITGTRHAVTSKRTITSPVMPSFNKRQLEVNNLRETLSENDSMCSESSTPLRRKSANALSKHKIRSRTIQIVLLSIITSAAIVIIGTLASTWTHRVPSLVSEPEINVASKPDATAEVVPAESKATEKQPPENDKPESIPVPTNPVAAIPASPQPTAPTPALPQPRIPPDQGPKENNPPKLIHPKRIALKSIRTDRLMNDINRYELTQNIKIEIPSAGATADNFLILPKSYSDAIKGIERTEGGVQLLGSGTLGPDGSTQKSVIASFRTTNQYFEPVSIRKSDPQTLADCLANIMICGKYDAGIFSDTPIVKLPPNELREFNSKFQGAASATINIPFYYEFNNLYLCDAKLTIHESNLNRHLIAAEITDSHLTFEIPNYPRKVFILVTLNELPARSNQKQTDNKDREPNIHTNKVTLNLECEPTFRELDLWAEEWLNWERHRERLQIKLNEATSLKQKNTVEEYESKIKEADRNKPDMNAQQVRQLKSEIRSLSFSCLLVLRHEIEGEEVGIVIGDIDTNI